MSFLKAQIIEAIEAQINNLNPEEYRAGLRRAVETIRSFDFNVPVQPDIKISSHKVAVDQNYFWDLSMRYCPRGKVQLLGRGGLPFYGEFKDVPNFAIAWAGLPKLPPHFNPEILK